jgi:hypothetical protein
LVKAAGWALTGEDLFSICSNQFRRFRTENRQGEGPQVLKTNRGKPSRRRRIIW